MRLALGVCYSGSAYQGWQSQSSGLTVQDKLEKALTQFANVPRISTLCAGRTDAGVHGLMQVVHFDTDLQRDPQSWVRGTNRYLPADIAVQWAQIVPDSFHCRASATGRRYVYVLLDSPVRPSLDAGRVGWSYRPLAEALKLPMFDITEAVVRHVQVPTAGEPAFLFTYRNGGAKRTGLR